jgi:deazaflavin-dependent oxidoreductase (nitroreductase family)
MNTTTTELTAGHSRRSGILRSMTRPIGPIASRFAGRRLFPLYAILHHIGRTSGKPYATTVVALQTPNGFVIPLPFGDATQWAKNLFAAGGGSVRFAGRDFQVVEPRLVDRDEARAVLPGWVWSVSGRIGLRQFVMVRRVSS